jgi:hypothetical protein
LSPWGQTRLHGQGPGFRGWKIIIIKKKVKISNFFFNPFNLHPIFSFEKMGAFATLKAIVDFDPFLAGKWS